jgi:hypothetical protein
MLSRYNPIDIEAALRAVSPPPPFPPASDRAAWDAARETLGAETMQLLMLNAEAAAQKPLASLTATMYLEFMRNGQREGYQTPARERRENLMYLMLAECLEGRGRFNDALLNLAWAICEESSWSWPAHQRELTDMERPVIDLSVAMTALDLAELDALLGAQLEPALGKRIRYEVNRRCFTPYLTRHDHWWLHQSHLRTVNNWTAVCNGGVTGAALYLESDLSRLAEIIARCARSLDDYLATFDADGGSTEGPGYWSYGFGYFTLIAHLVEQRTQGAINFFEGEPLLKIVQYPLRVMLSPGHYVNFSDADRLFQFVPAHLEFLARRFALPNLSRLAQTQTGSRHELSWGLRSVFWRPAPETDGMFTPARHDWFGGMMWMIARYDPQDPQALVLAAKGGHNGEMHNQNDVGNFIVHVNGESVIADVGRGRYTRFYFGPERYDHFVNSSLGHSVPVPNGQLQPVGKSFGATLLAHETNDSLDCLALEMKDAYPPAADLASLRRTLTLRREAPRGWVELVDEARFASGAHHFETALTTFGKVEISESAVLLRGERGALHIAFDTTNTVAITPRLEVIENVDLAEGTRNVQRVVFALAEPAPEGVIRLNIIPV